MLTEIISKTVADKTVDSILKRIERAVPVPEPGDGGFDAAMRQAFNMGAACMAAHIKNGPVPTKRIALMGVSFDDLTLADWEAAKLGQIESPFTFNDYQMLDT